MVITLLLVLLIGSQPAKFNVKGQCTIGETTCNDDNGMVCYDEICDNSNDCQDTSDETTSSCIWKGLLKIEYNFTIWVEHVNDGHNQFSQFFGRLVGDTTSIQLTEEIDEDIYTFAIDHNIKAIFYADSKHKQIKQIRYDKLPRVKTIYTGTSSKVTDIDIDIISHNVYWIDDQYNAIVILDYEGTYHRQIITGLDKPIGLAIDSYHGHVYWSDCSDSTPRIERCTLSGDGRETFYNITSGCPTGITVHNDRLFYLDTINHHLIELNLYSDADPVVIWKDTNTPEMSLRDVAVSVTSYILTNSANKEIIEKGGELLIKSTNGTPYAIQYISPQDFTDDSCSNSSCDQLCTIDVSAPQCLCGQGYDLIIDIYSTSCQPDEMIISRSEFILANDTHILGLPGNFIDIQPANYLIHSISKTARVTAIDFNWSLKTLYYSTQRGVYSLLLDKGHQPLRINNDETVKALAVDWYSGNVYYVGEEGITVSTHDGAVFEALESIDLLVTDIAVHPGQMSLFVSSWDEDRGKILKTYLDGSNQTVLYENSNMKPVAITANYNFERLYWYDVISKRIMSIDFYGNDVHMADPLGISFTDITLFQNYLYWSDASKSSVNAVSLNNNTSHIMSVNTTGAPRTIVMFDESRQPQGETAYICSDDCDRLCLVSPSGSSCVGTRIGTTVYPTSQQTAIISLTAESLQTTQSDVTEFLSETINEEVSETYTVTVEFTEDKTTHMYNATQPTTIIKDEHTTIEKITEVTTEEQTTDVTVTTTPSPITAFTTTTVTTRQNPTTASPTTTLTTRPSPTTAFPMTTVTTSSATASPATTQSTPLTTRKTGAITQSKLPNIIPDENAPELDHCDEKITAETTKLPVKVKDLTGPIFIDDEGSDVYVTSDISVIKVWGESTVTYTGCDSAGNCAPDTCQTIVEVIYPRCPSLSNPTNGELRCTEVEFEILCMVVCDPGFAQPNGVSTEWSCTTNTGDGQWIPGNNVPPCQKTTSKQAAFSGSFPFEGRTTDSFSVEVLGQSFAKSLTAGLAVCASKVAYCSVFLGESTGVSRGGRSISQKREPVVRKRETPISTDSTTILNFTMTAELNGTLPTNSSGLQDETNVLAEDLQESLDDLITSGLDLEVDGYTYSLDIGGVIVSDVILVCMDGEVPATNGECAVCPSGTFTNEDQSACLLCGQDTYQEKTGQFGCLECPEGTVTFGQGGDNITMCLELCDAGYQSYHGVEPCDPCPLGFYKQSDMNPWCKACSEDYPNTKLVGSTSDAACLKSDHTMDDIGMNLLYATIAIGVCGVVIIILSVTYWQYRKRIMKRKERNPTLENEHILERVFEMKVDQIANCHSPVRRPLNGVMDSHYNDSISSIHDIPTSSPRYMPRQVRFRDAPSIISSSHSETHFKPIHSAIGEEVEEELSSYQSEDRNSMSSYQNDVSSEMLVLSPSSLQDTYFDSDRHIHDSIRYSATNVPVQNQNTLPEIPPPMQQIGLGQQLQSSDPSAHISSLKMVLSKIISESSSQSQSQPASYPPVDYHDHRYYDRVLANPIREPDLDIIQTRDNTTSNWTSNFQLRRTPTPENTLITSPEQQEYQFGRQLLNDLSHSYADCDNNENTIHL